MQEISTFPAILPLFRVDFKNLSFQF